MATELQVLEALRGIRDPDSQKDVVTLGLVRDVAIADGAVSLTLAYALMQGNIGTAYRQRTQITMFFFIFMGVGIVERRRQRALGMAGAPAPAQQRQP